MSKPLRVDDPAAWMLIKGMDEQQKVERGELASEDTKWISKTTVYNEKCYICRDPEFALMGLPLCYPCPECGAHVPADDTICDNGHEDGPWNYEDK